MFSTHLKDVPLNSRILVTAKGDVSSETPFFVAYREDNEGKKQLTTDDGQTYHQLDFQRFGTKDKNLFLQILWTGPYPDLPEEDIVAYYGKLSETAFNLNRGDTLPLFVYLTQIEPSAMGYIVHPVGTPPLISAGKDNDIGVQCGHAIWSREPINIDANTLPEGVSAGDLLFCSYFECKAEVIAEEIEVTTLLEEARIIAPDITEEAVLRYVPPSTYASKELVCANREFDVFRWMQTSFKIATLEDYAWQRAIAVSRVEPDMAIILSVRDEENKNYLVSVYQSGYELHGLENLTDELDGIDIPEEGAWAFVNPKIESGYSLSYDYGQDYYFELHGKFVPLTLEHLSMMKFDLNELGEHIIDYVRDAGHEISGTPEDVALTYMDMAAKAHSEAAIKKQVDLSEISFPA